MFLFYNLLLACAALLSLPWWLFQMRLPKYRAGLRERLGQVPERLQGDQTGLNMGACCFRGRSAGREPVDRRAAKEIS